MRINDLLPEDIQRTYQTNLGAVITDGNNWTGNKLLHLVLDDGTEEYTSRLFLKGDVVSFVGKFNPNEEPVYATILNGDQIVPKWENGMDYSAPKLRLITAEA
ncbi:MAG: hypothetical protein ACE5FT_06705 [Candidatus Nanoarchaeia archaeon]